MSKTTDDDHDGSWDFWRGFVVGVLAVVGMLMLFSLADEVQGVINGR